MNCVNSETQKKRARDYGIVIGVLKPGKNNSITDVPGVKVGHITIREGDSVNTGVTAILPCSGNIFQNKLPAAIYIGNGFGKLTGSYVNIYIKILTLKDLLQDHCSVWPEQGEVHQTAAVILLSQSQQQRS